MIVNKKLRHKHESDAGFDLPLKKDLTIKAKDYVPMIETGIHVAIPEGYFGLVKERSSMAIRGVIVMGGVIDAGYRGEIMVNLANLGEFNFEAKKGDRIAQLIIIPVNTEMEVGEVKEDTERGAKGFGSTGK